MTVGGLGQLIDGRTGHDNVENDLTGFGKGELAMGSNHFTYNSNDWVYIDFSIDDRLRMGRMAK